MCRHSEILSLKRSPCSWTVPAQETEGSPNLGLEPTIRRRTRCSWCGLSFLTTLLWTPSQGKDPHEPGPTFAIRLLFLIWVRCQCDFSFELVPVLLDSLKQIDLHSVLGRTCQGPILAVIQPLISTKTHVSVVEDVSVPAVPIDAAFSTRDQYKTVGPEGSSHPALRTAQKCPADRFIVNNVTLLHCPLPK